ncbi:iron-containing alcohol dehydrogenase [Nonomuraea sp. NPDC052265]|uniref:iron-containing alcohol dehydrogenase n=1 Tax=Nonomuraea sp. NPDC052265 TaxID=3364374 RepID=UPI0037C54368
MTRENGHFEWRVPTRIVFGNGRLGEVGQEAAAIGTRPVLITDTGLVDGTTVRTVIQILGLHGVSPAAICAVPVSPSLSDVTAIMKSLRGTAGNLVVAVGGGSAMDAAKMLALLLTNPHLPRHEGWDGTGLIDVNAEPLRPPLPTLMVPTSAATGSEINGVVGLVHQGHKRLFITNRLVPTTALIDPDLTRTLPLTHLAAGGVETLCRVLGPYLSDDTAGGTTDAVALGLITATLSAVDGIRQSAADDAARADLAWSVTLSMTQVAMLGRDPWGQVIWYLQSGVSNQMGVSKGVAMAALLPTYLRQIRRQTGLGPVLGLAGRLDCLDSLGDGLAETLVADRLRSWGLPSSLRDIGVRASDLPRIVHELTSHWTSAGRLADVPHEALEEFYLEAMEPPPDPETDSIR